MPNVKPSKCLMLYFDASPHDIAADDAHANRWVVGEFSDGGYRRSNCFDGDVRIIESFATLDEAVARLRLVVGSGVALSSIEGQE